LGEDGETVALNLDGNDCGDVDQNIGEIFYPGIQFTVRNGKQSRFPLKGGGAMALNSPPMYPKSAPKLASPFFEKTDPFATCESTLPIHT